MRTPATSSRLCATSDAVAAALCEREGRDPEEPWVSAPLRVEISFDEDPAAGDADPVDERGVHLEIGAVVFGLSRSPRCTGAVLVDEVGADTGGRTIVFEARSGPQGEERREALRVGQAPREVAADDPIMAAGKLDVGHDARRCSCSDRRLSCARAMLNSRSLPASTSAAGTSAAGCLVDRGQRAEGHAADAAGQLGADQRDR